ncbi:MAG: helix-hairpin-helix domain-containing protein [Calditrichaeota bacterium]|nr:helix-hairpin-helix domain-containing protein [Calditrichota bacterium]
MARRCAWLRANLRSKDGMPRCLVPVLLALGTFLLLLPTSQVHAQVEPEQVLEQEEEGSDSSELAEILADLRARPLDINRATVAELQQLPWISPLLAAKIVAFRRLRGRIQNIEELLEVPEIDDALLETIAEYLLVVPPAPALWWGEARLRASGRLERSRGFRTGAYPGSPLKSYARLKWGVGNHVTGGALVEKDAGEQRLDDYGNYFVSASLPSLSTQVVLGHYQMEAGQGLVLWSPYGHGKGSEPAVAAVRKARGLRPYSSATEYGGLRGVAVETMLGPFAVTALASDLPLDATLDEDGMVTSFYESGYHRTATEQAKRRVVRERLAGGRLAYGDNPLFKAGITWYASEFDRAVDPPDSLRRRFVFRGKHNSVAGMDLGISFASARFFAEGARSASGGVAAVAGILVEIPRAKVVAHYRHYDKDFYNRHALPFASSTGVANNEQGFYLGAQWRVRPGTRVAFYYDTSKRPWRTYSFPMPTGAEDGLAQVEQRLVRGVVALLRLRYARNNDLVTWIAPPSRDVSVVAQRSRLAARAQLQYDPVKSISLRGRVERSHVVLRPVGSPFLPERKSHGLLLSQELVARFAQRLQCQFRVVLFDTDDYESRIYAYESDLPGVLTNRLFAGRGSSWYLLVRARVGRAVFLGAKFTSTYYDDRETVGSGLDETEGPLSRTLSVQIDVGH